MNIADLLMKASAPGLSTNENSHYLVGDIEASALPVPHWQQIVRVIFRSGLRYLLHQQRLGRWADCANKERVTVFSSQDVSLGLVCPAVDTNQKSRFSVRFAHHLGSGLNEAAERGGFSATQVASREYDERSVSLRLCKLIQQVEPLDPLRTRDLSEVVSTVNLNGEYLHFDSLRGFASHTQYQDTRALLPRQLAFAVAVLLKPPSHDPRLAFPTHPRPCPSGPRRPRRGQWLSRRDAACERRTGGRR